MREIKFKFWLDAENIIGEGVWINHKEKVIGVLWTDDPEKRVLSYKFSEGVLLQYTGLVDKNGKEIYEGDVVKSNGGLTVYAAWSEKYPGFHWKNDSGFTAVMSLGDHCEIIGNIHENEEFIKVG